MPQHKMILQAGVNSQQTRTLNSLGWAASNLMRWQMGLAQKLGGWTELVSTPCVGVARGMHGFEDLSFNSYLGIGTNSRLQLYTAGVLSDITPIRATSNITPSFSTTMGSATVTVTDVANNISVDDWINLLTPVSVGGIVLSGFYQCESIVDNDNYTITAASNAASDESNTGLVPEYTTQSGQPSVTVTLADHGYTAGQTYYELVPTTVASLVISGPYLVASVTDADNFVVVPGGNASSSTSVFENAGSARIQYLLPTGLVSSQPLSGYGTGTYGTGLYGQSSSAIGKSPLRNWSIDNFGQNMLAVPTNGSLYQWLPPASTGNVATLVSNAPAQATAMFVAMPERQVIMLGATDPVTGNQDLLFVRFSDVNDYSSSTAWTASSTNQAGSFRLSRGSAIVGGCQAPQAGLIWTDLDLWAMIYIQPPLVYSFNIIGTGCGMIGQQAFGTLGRSTFWMSDHGIYVYGDNGVQPVLCPVWDKIFGDLDKRNGDKSFVAVNSMFNELMFFYPSLSGGAGEIDSYVKFNAIEGEWDYGSLVRTAWVDQSPVANEIGIDGDGLIVQHETSPNDNGDAMPGTYIQSGYADITDGTYFMFVDQIIPDIYLTGDNASVNITVYATNYPGDTPRSYGPYTVTSTTEYISLRTRARQLAFKIESSTLNTFWRIGAIRYRAAPAGRR